MISRPTEISEIIGFVQAIFISFKKLILKTYKKNENQIYLLLDGITDTRNFGSIIRTSVDHGTATDLVGTGDVDISSFVQALKVAREISKSAL